MHKFLSLLSGIAVALLILFASISLVSAIGPDDPISADEGRPAAAASFGDETHPPEPIVRVPDAGITAPVTQAYFVPEDNDGTATYINLYNTGTVTETVNLQAFNANGLLTVNLDVAVGASGRVRLVSDSVVVSPPPSWADAVSANFTDFSTIAVLHLPRGVKADVYVVYNSGTGVIDPRADQGTVPVRLSSDPLTVHLPTIQR